MGITTRILSGPLDVRIDDDKEWPFYDNEEHGCFTIISKEGAITAYDTLNKVWPNKVMYIMQRIDRPMRLNRSVIYLYVDKDTPIDVYLNAVYKGKHIEMLTNPYYHAHTNRAQATPIPTPTQTL